ncbi:GTP cyclohydrolase I FolE2 [Pseudoalteromonas sp. NEC-BIFX-2020_015]|uniref:GTP cyclohydrolase FolE2 n=1 Tax=Pseudoalteromonas sp. NEC-BIFX-2020_015 TaxID=2729544 RepID=UPI0014615CB6|nr:GTP cyclohydrolase FolE2 [Pseudoalteromonas sp. NEC-BIFX-2020_015]NMR24699.1 GTP cyclohydrolase I FolE2 [Pseudoalteromonas sp. NEC-BIFX-2020_015]
MKLQLPDIASGQRAGAALPLKWVGMEGIAIPLNLIEQPSSSIAAKADVFVSLDEADAKGIHMSRLYLRVKDILAREQLSVGVLAALLKELVESQQGLSLAARLQLAFELTIRKPALLSDQFGYQTYPVSIRCEYINEQMNMELSLTIPYSSTCPCSAALSRQAMSDAITSQFSQDLISKEQLLDWVTSQQGSVATPHSQRSYAYLKLRLQNNALPNLETLIKNLEEVIGTPVQTAVKREDEQAFAKLNAENLMFCEDAARRLKLALENNGQVIDYWFKVEHQESLHAHNAVVIDHKSSHGYEKL